MLTATIETVAPNPPRYWWLKRIVVGIVAVACLLTGMRLWWGHAASRKMEAYIAGLRARGELAVLDDLKAPPLPDEKNAAYFLRRAAALMSKTAKPPGGSAPPPYPPVWHRLADAAIEANQQSLALVREARSRDQADWGILFLRYMYAPLFTQPSSDTSQQLMRGLLFDAAKHAHVNGDDAEAMERIADILHLSQVVQEPPCVSSHLVSLGIRGGAAWLLCGIAPELRIGEGEECSATRVQVRAMIEKLLDEDALSRSTRRGFQGEAVIAMERIAWETRSSRILRPMYDVNAVYAASQWNRMAAASGAPTAPQAMAQLPALAVPSGIAVLGGLPSSTSLLYDEIVPVPYLKRFGGRAAAVSLAVRLYREDYDGQYPPSLAALVPDYLSAVPADPLAPDERPLGYVILNGRPLVYSVGTNGIDDTAAGALPPDVLYDSGTDTADEWRDLSRWRASGSGQVLEEQDDESDAPGEGDESEEGDQQP